MKLETVTTDSLCLQKTTSHHSAVYIDTKDYKSMSKSELPIELTSIDSKMTHQEQKLLCNNNIFSSGNLLNIDYKDLLDEIESLNRNAGNYTLTMINKVENNWF